MPADHLTHLKLDKFEVLFHLLCGYYLLLSIAHEWFGYYFDFAITISDYNRNITAEKLTDLNRGLEFVKADFLREKKKQIASISSEIEDMVSIIFALIKFQIKWQLGYLKIIKIKRNVEKSIKKVRRNDKSIPYHTKRDDERQTTFFTFYQFYYIISGCFCVTLLILQGFIEEWNREINLEILNVIDLLVLVYVFVRIYRNKVSNFFLGTKSIWKISIVFGFTFLLAIIIPTKKIDHHLFSFPEIDGINFYDCQIVLAVALAFIPAIAHSLYLYYTSSKCKNVLLVEAVAKNLLSKSKLPGSPPPPIPKFPDR